MNDPKGELLHIDSERVGFGARLVYTINMSLSDSVQIFRAKFHKVVFCYFTTRQIYTKI